MAFDDLREYINFMRSKKKIIEINDEVDPILEIAEISRRATYNHLPPLLFKNVKGYPNWSVITNIYYSIEAFYELFNTNNLEEVTASFLENMLGTMPLSFSGKIRSLFDMLKLGKILPRNKKPEFKEANLDFNKIPALKTWPKDAGRYLTFSILITKDPDTGVHNLSVYRIQLLNEKEAIVHWQALKRGALTSFKYKERGIIKIPAAIVNGVDPILAFVAASPVPPGLDKYLFAGILRNEGVSVHELDNGLLVPSSAETVFEGYVDINDVRLEGPFGDHLGYYTPPDYYPVFKIERAYARENPIFHATSVGKPPLEDAWIGKAVDRLFLPFIRMLIPEIVDMNLPEYGLFTGIGIFSIKKRYPGQAKKTMMSIWGLGQLSLLKMVIIVDSDVNVQDLNQVLYAISTTVDPKRDVLIVDNVITDSLDHTTPYPPLGSKIGIDATRKFKEELGKEWPEELTSDENTVKKITPLWEKIKSQNRL